ncbi:Signal transduction histidine kinase [Clostridium cavendishii DSM 21758]|uniref:histidine kinase n=1 Tax=Clostridium cavendishii DSM 21758 TaxID=1121302 RepID=A0A1M6I815_9CLOT|nr:HAMP domain-containing sensor histidine kinase [Clostridium cavendishii]SHJ30503.1 Signal transduction histidine kinase [Clostridium cavendishii DSM 21758]
MILKALKKFIRKFRKVYLTTLRQYVLFFIFISFILCFGVGTIVYEIVRMTTSEEYIKDSQKFFMASEIVNKDYKNIDATTIKSIGGWVEILDENKNLIYVIGNKKDTKKSYTEEEFINFLSDNRNQLKRSSDFYYSIISFDNDNKKYYCLVKLPYNSVEITIDATMEGKLSDKYVERIGLKIAAMLLLFIVLLIFLLFIYAFITSRRIVKPLRKILEGIKKMTNGDYKARIDFRADNEFADIKDAFNFMAEKIEISEKERKKVEDLKSQLLVDISHDLKTPITSIQGYSKALYDGVVDSKEKQERYLSIIYDKSRRVTELIDNLHELTKLDSSRYEVHKSSEDFTEVLRELLAEFYKEIEDKEFELDVDIPEKEIVFEFDRLEIIRAISNIIANSLKYNKNKTKLKIQLTEKEEKIQLIIADNGVGISDELKEKIFEPFTRGDVSRRSTGGTGLGLSISKKIIEKHNGIIFLKENIEYKTEFVIEIPYF